MDLGPPKDSKTGGKNTESDVLAWAPPCIEVGNLDPGHSQLRNWAEGCIADSGLERSDHVVKSIYSRCGKDPRKSRRHVKNEADGEEDDADDVGEEESIVESPAPEGNGEEEKYIHRDQTKETESNAGGLELLHDDALPGPQVD